ncbi:MAG: DUF2279 domain-containing protein [Bacteroidia bacterium]
MRHTLLALCLLAALSAAAQRRPFHYQAEPIPSQAFFRNDTTLNRTRQRQIVAIGAGSYGATMLYMGTIWYANEDLGAFRFFDDLHEWRQIDKGGHMLGAYTGSRWMIDLCRWAGVERRKAIVAGSLTGFVAMSSIEVFDGFGETWGFSWPDIGANFVGASLAATNQLLWNENRLQLKASYHRSPYAGNPDFAHLFGSNYPEWVLKDYNGHTIWLSVRVHSFLPQGSFRDHYPRWLNLAVGYGAEGLEGGYDDPASDWRTREYRQLYLSLDLDLTQIPTRSPLLRTVFNTIAFVRIPFPAVRFDRQGVAFVPLE